MANTQDPRATEAAQRFQRFKESREAWAFQAQEDQNFRHGAQWSKEQIAELKKLRQAPVVVNVIHPAVEQGKAALTSNKPRFSSTGREGSDMKLGSLFSDILSYVWDVNDGNTKLKQAIEDYYVQGMGVFQAYVDPHADNGRGEVCFTTLNPLDVYVDPSAKDVFCRDASAIIVSKVVTGTEIARCYPQYESVLKVATKVPGDDSRPATDRVGLEGQGSGEEVLDVYQDKYRLIEQYAKRRVRRWHVFDPDLGLDKVLDEEKYKEFLKGPAVVEKTAQGVKFITADAHVAAALELVKRFNGVFHYVVDQNDPFAKPMMQAGPENPDEAAQAGLAVVPGSQTELSVVTMREMVDAGVILSESILVNRVNYLFTIGNQTVYDGDLDLDEYPIVFMMNRHNRNPYPMSDVRFCRGLQEYINKLRSLIIAHASNATSVKLVIPRGSADKKELLAEWRRVGGGVVEYDAELGAPIVAGPVPLPNELYKNEADARGDVQEIFGLYALGQGDPGAAPATYKGTVAIDEMGQRRMKSKKDDVEASLNQLAKIIVQLIQQTYTETKAIRVLRPNNTAKEFVINQKVEDPSGMIKGRLNDVTVGRYDVVVVSGSTLPVNRWARFEYYMELYKAGIIDQVEVLKQTEVADQEGVLERMDQIKMLTQQLMAVQEELKNVKGDLQTASREAVHAQKRVEVEKFKGDLNDKRSRLDASTELYRQRLSDELGMHQEKMKAEREVARARSKKPKPTA
jgi:hypothetical protein